MVLVDSSVWIDFVANASATAWTGDELGLWIYDEIAASTDLVSAGALNLYGYVNAQAERPGTLGPFKAIGGAGPLSNGETATCGGRDVAAVRRDVEALLRAGILDTTDADHIEFP